MQKNKEQSLRRFLSLFLALIMILTSLPLNVFAEEPSTGTRAVATPDWEVSDEEAEADHWPLTANNRLVEAANADSIKNPNIEYGGTFNLEIDKSLQFFIKHNQVQTQYGKGCF